MTLSRRRALLIAINCAFWVVACYASWNRLIPERFITSTVILSLFFSVPFGCCSLPFLVVSEGHDHGWRIAVYGAMTFANSVAWSWSVDWLWAKLSGETQPRGFPVTRGSDENRVRVSKVCLGTPFPRVGVPRHTLQIA